MELSTLVGVPARASAYREAAEHMLASLMSDAYLSDGTDSSSLLLHGTGHRPAEVSDPEADGVANPDPQCAGKPWKNQERRVCGLGCELALLLPPTVWLWRRRARR